MINRKIKATCSNCNNQYEFSINTPTTLSCQKCGSVKVTIEGSGSFEALCVKCNQKFILEANKHVDAVHDCRNKILVLNVLSEKEEIAQVQSKFELQLRQEEIKEAKKQLFKDKPNIAIIVGRETGHVNWPYHEQLKSSLEAKNNVILIHNHLFSRKDYALLYSCDLVIGQHCQASIFAIRLRTPTIIIHTPISVEYRGDVGFYGINDIQQSSVEEVIKKVNQYLEKPNLSYCIVTHNCLDKTEECIKQIRESKRAHEEIVIVDNSSNDGTTAWLKDQKDIVSMFNDENLGCIRARNQAIKAAKGRYIFILDNDQFVSMDSLHLLRLIDADVVGVEGWQLSANGSPMSVSSGEIDYIGAGGMLTRKEIFTEVDYFDEAFSPAWFEDPDICMKFKQRGYALGFCNAKIKHESHSTNSTQNNFDSQEVWNRNRKLFLQKWGGTKNLKKISTKPKVLIMVDVVGWAWDYKTRQLQKHLSNDFDIEIVYQKQTPTALKDMGYDLYMNYECTFNSYFVNIDKKRKITGVTAHTYKNFHNYVVRLLECDAVHINSKMLYEEVKKLHPNCFYVPNGVDHNLFKYVERDINSEFTVGYVGKDIPHKGFKEFIRPACEIAGVKLKAQTAKYKDAHKIDHSEMPKFYEDVDCILIASEMDGTPNQLIESSSVGRTFISNKIGNVPEFINKNNGIMIEGDRDVQKYVEQINILKNNREQCKQMGIESRKTVEKAWTWEIMSNNYRDMFKKVLGI